MEMEPCQLTSLLSSFANRARTAGSLLPTPSRANSATRRFGSVGFPQYRYRRARNILRTLRRRLRSPIRPERPVLSVSGRRQSPFPTEIKVENATSPGQCVPHSRNGACSPPGRLHGLASQDSSAQRIDNDNHNSGEVDGRVIHQALNGASLIAAARGAYAARPDAVISVERSPFSHSRPSSHPG
ncbi:hypothetical protein QE432_004872 [Agrobacterium sp. SORGH_AS 745]|nr:hypothetical protein [Agrobacterium tumefaciens]MDQ1223244.1 hypothetical protein [Agrobacterium sp. SORGH_AS_0745]